MDHPAGAAFLIGGIDTIEATDEYTVEITLTEANTTFLPRLGYTVASIVPSDGSYPAPDGPLGDDAARAGRGVRPGGADRHRSVHAR
jgi:peptide/nickel transport system substrate-binding protein